MGQKKLIRFEAIKGFPNVLEYPEGMAGKWPGVFGNDYPLTVELACGKGEYTVGLARLYPQRNFLGVDVKGNRIWRGASNALAEGLRNAAFLRTQIDRIASYFSSGEVSEIWLTFPDPQLRGSKLRKRLTHPKFLRLYRVFLRASGIVHLKTDSPDLYEFTKTVIDLHGLPVVADIPDISRVDATPELSIRTHYEGLDIAGSNRIHYLAFRLDGPLDPAKDDVLKSMVQDAAGT